MTRRLSIWLLLSLGIHVGLAVAALTVVAATAPPPLFIDLVHGILATDGGAPGGSPADGATVPPAAAPGHGSPSAAARPSAPAPAVAPKAAPPVKARSETMARASEPAPRPGPMRPAGEPPQPDPVRPSPEPVPSAPEPPAGSTEPIRPTGEPSVPSLPAGATEIGPPSSAGGANATDGGASTLAEADTGDGASPGSGGGRTSGSWGGEGGALGPGARDGSVLALAIPGDGGGGGAEYEGHLALLRRRVQESATYPAAARRRGLTGTVQVELEIQPTGVIAQVALATSSSHRVLDEAALEAVRGVGRLPFPPNVRPRLLRVRLPVVFDLQ